ncbi:hypothetical protein K8B33_15920 [Alcanivorax sp. JB21]|uniref:hypothetical protein n=1 Tax=Alcanivorax limicola TaxID=2874102 RepID=UPI001CBF0159|nr:hypothetical protein [Alcanivorax limicola]MBZ2188664.1 hypothetical protein [Alcanivorax limicola]MBZ2190594.1 hypothetical protein [Alcanivorax limicola]
MNAHLKTWAETELHAYTMDIPAPGVDEERRAGMEMIAATAQRLIDALDCNDLSKAKLEVLTFSRQGSDVYFEQPESFKPLAKAIGEIRKEII